MSVRNSVQKPWKRMLTKEEAADYCGFTSAQRFESAARPHVAPVNYGSGIRYDRVRLDEWLDTMTLSAADHGADIIAAAFNSSKSTRRAAKGKPNE